MCGERILTPIDSIARSTKRSLLQINLIFIVLFKPILDCPLQGPSSGTGKQGLVTGERRKDNNRGVGHESRCEDGRTCRARGAFRPYQATLSCCLLYTSPS